MFTNLDNPTNKYDVAVEVRHYFSKTNYSGFNLGLYAGLEKIHTPAFFRNNSDVGYDGTYFGFTPGIKLSYTSRLNSWFQLEPFIGVSTPWYGYDFDRLHNEMRNNDPACILNVGVKVGFYQLLKFGTK